MKILKIKMNWFSVRASERMRVLKRVGGFFFSFDVVKLGIILFRKFGWLDEEREVCVGFWMRGGLNYDS